MKCILYIVAFLMGLGNAYSQKRVFDSIVKVGSTMGLNDFDKAIQNANEGIKASLQMHDSVSYACFKRTMGIAHYFKGDYANAVNYYFEAVKVLERINAEKELAGTYNELAKLYRKTRKLDLAEETYDKAMRIYTLLSDSNNISAIYNESGVVYEYQENFNEALRRYKLSLSISERMSNSTGIAYALSNIAGVLSLQNQFYEANLFLKKALVIRKQLKDTFGIAINYSDLGIHHFYDKKFRDALLYLDSSNQIANYLKYAELLSQNYLFISNVNEKMGNKEEALIAFKKHVRLKDSIFTMESDKNINELNTKYQTEKKDFELVKSKAEIFEQQQQNKQKNLVILSISLIASLLFSLGFLYYRKKKIEQKAQLDAELAKEKDMRTKAIVEAEEKERRRIAQDLHDGVGQILSAAKLNLSSLQSKLRLEDAGEKEALSNALSLIDDSVKEVRTVSHNMMPNTLIKLGLASAIKEFISKIGNLPNLKVDLEIVGLDKRLDEQLETVIYRVIQEIVSNIIKHSKANKLNLQIIKHENELTVMIEDNGIGFDTSKINEFTGIGLKNIISRIEFVNGNVHFDSTPMKGTNVIIDVPILS